ncbi:hypothetical protein B0H10DRAFT_1954049 [Mycena sp. CBHHK59/15]|nr:hypothetical protein B0H10DRAFT_1954049 [Mycena sp. CBHHK59/15]
MGIVSRCRALRSNKEWGGMWRGVEATAAMGAAGAWLCEGSSGGRRREKLGAGDRCDGGAQEEGGALGDHCVWGACAKGKGKATPQLSPPSARDTHVSDASGGLMERTHAPPSVRTGEERRGTLYLRCTRPPGLVEESRAGRAITRSRRKNAQIYQETKGVLSSKEGKKEEYTYQMVGGGRGARTETAAGKGR